eukprot:5870-Heterococcus_DN1.PRE.2
MEEVASEELSRLRAELASSKQLLTSKDAQLLACKDELLACKDHLVATKDELLASRAAEVQRCQELLQHTRKGSAAESDAVAADSSKRQRLQDCSVSPLVRDDVLDHVFSYVGGGDHLYTGGVSRRWRGRYIQYCTQHSSAESDKKLVTRHRSVLMTEADYSWHLTAV